MKRTALTIALLVFLSALVVTITILPKAIATTHYVGGAGPGNYTTIQAAVDGANPGDNVYVYDGTYYENVVVSEPLSLFGENTSTTVVDGGESGVVILVTSDWVNITGLTARKGGSGFYDAGLRLDEVENCHIAHNIFSESTSGILVYGYSHHIVIENNTVLSNYRDGIALGASENVTLRNNTLKYNGIFIWGSQLEHWNTHSIDDTNTVSGRAVYYWKNVTGGQIPPGAGQVLLVNSSNVEIRDQNLTVGTAGVIIGHSSNISVVGNNASSNTRSGIYVWSSNLIAISNNTLSGNGQAGTYLAYSDGNAIINNEARGNRDGIALFDSNGNLIADNIVRLNDNGIRLWSSDNNVIEGGEALNNVNGVLLEESLRNTLENITASDNEYGVYLDHSALTDMSNLTATNNTRNGVYLRESWGGVISGSNASLNDRSGIVLGSSSGTTVSNNTVSGNMFGIVLSYTGSSVLRNNTMIENGVYISVGSLQDWNTHTIDTSNTVNGKPVHYWKDIIGGKVPSGAGQVILANCTGVVVENQNTSLSSVGIALGFSSGNIIANNTALGNDQGAYLWKSTSNSIANNTFANNRLGIHLDSSSDYNNVTENFATNNWAGIDMNFADWNTVWGNNLSWNRHGIRLWYSDNNTIAQNNVTSNSWSGFYLLHSNFNRIYHNNVIGNWLGGMDDRATNDWDDGYPSGGNYWSDYNGADHYRGPAQDQSGSDGIGDTPYAIDADSHDRYPLVFPFGTPHPWPPRIIQARLSGKDSENVTISWVLSPDDGEGLGSVVLYEIFRGPSYDPEGSTYALVAALLNGTSSFVDSLAGEGDPNDHFYRLCAMDASSNRTCARSQAGKFTRPLSQGLNLVSIPLVQSNESVERVLQTLQYDKAWSYDASSGEWKWHMTSKEYGRGLRNVDNVAGLWVNVTGDCNLTVAGIVPTRSTIHLQRGWNLVSFPSFNSSYTAYDLRMDTGAVRVEGYDPAPPYHLRVLGDGEVLQVGYGYWVKVEADAVWTVDMS